jgi:ER membrane protein complex subunit 1
MISSHFSLLVTASTGSVQLWQDDVLQWAREESLASISQAELVELPEKKVLMSHYNEDEGFVTRVLRHTHDAKVDTPIFL